MELARDVVPDVFIASSPRGGLFPATCTSELRAQSFAADAADDETLLFVAQEPAGPIHGAAVDQLKPPSGRVGGMDMEAEIQVIAPAAGALLVNAALHGLELGSDWRQELALEQVVSGA
jgi:hypothetical protein